MVSHIFPKYAFFIFWNLLPAFIAAVVLPEYVLSFGGAAAWGALGGLVRALVDAKAFGRKGAWDVLSNGWLSIIIGAFSAPALNQVHIDIHWGDWHLADYVKDLPLSASDFLIGNFAVNLYAAGDKLLRMAPNLLSKLTPGGKEGEA